MSDRILIPCPDGWLALSRDVYDEAIRAARDAGFAGISAQAAPEAAPQRLLTAAELAKALDLSVTWVSQAARDGRIPVVKCGRYPRFDQARVVAALQLNASRHRV